jgi:hypothetical protein
MARRRRISLALGLLLAGAALAPPVRAQSASEIAAAKQWFGEGLALEEQGKFAEALERFQRAMEVKKTPQIQFHVGLCQLNTGALVEAVVSLEHASEQAKAEGNDQVDGAANAELDALRPRVPSLALSLTGASKPTRATLDGVPLSPAAFEAPIPVNPGHHEIVASFESGEVRRAFQVAERARATVEIEAPSSAAAPPTATAPTPSPPAPPEAPPSAPSAPAAGSGPGVVPWVLIGAGVVATAGGFYFWKVRSDKKDELDGICPSRTTCPADRESDVNDLESQGRNANLFALGLWGVGAAALATGGVLLLGGGDKEKAATRVAPALGPKMAGAFVSGRF